MNTEITKAQGAQILSNLNATNARANEQNNTLKTPQNWLNKEDTWANIIGIGLVLVICAAWAAGSFGIFDIFRVKFSSWDISNIHKILSDNPIKFITHIAAVFAFFGILFFIVSKFLGKDSRSFLGGFSLLFALSLIVFILGASKFAKTWQLETPLIALIIGLLLSNLTRIPTFFENSLLTEFYVKIGIVLMGATLPLNVLVSAGGVAILQACIITCVTFFSIFFFATKIFKLEPAFGATLGAGGSICGVSAAIVVGNAAQARKEHISVAISIVVIWAVAMVIIMPLVCRALGLDMGVAGAWIGTSEFADAAGLAAAQSLGSERAIAAFTLMKVIGRDMFVGVWAVLVAFLSIAVWNKNSTHSSSSESKVALIWQRFPKFILGFIVASIFVSIFMLFIESGAHKAFQKEALGFVKELRNWVFTWTFLCIGLSTQIAKIIAVGYKPFVAFSLGAAINLPLGFILSQYIFVDFWSNFLRG